MSRPLYALECRGTNRTARFRIVQDHQSEQPDTLLLQKLDHGWIMVEYEDLGDHSTRLDAVGTLVGRIGPVYGYREVRDVFVYEQAGFAPEEFCEAIDVDRLDVTIDTTELDEEAIVE